MSSGEDTALSLIPSIWDFISCHDRRPTRQDLEGPEGRRRFRRWHRPLAHSLTHARTCEEGGKRQRRTDRLLLSLFSAFPRMFDRTNCRVVSDRASERTSSRSSCPEIGVGSISNPILIRLRANGEAAYPNVDRELNPSTSIFSCRKRHNSEAYSDSSGDDYNSGMWSSGSDERSATPIMSECTAALVLMNLSLSPGTLGGGNGGLGGLGGVAQFQRRPQPSKRQQIAPPPEGERTCVFATASMTILKVHSFIIRVCLESLASLGKGSGHGRVFC